MRFLVVVHLLLPYCAQAQKVRFEFFTTANGLAGNNTSTITQDDQGFLWFVNEGKIHRYDGRNFEIIPGPDHQLFQGLASYQDSLLVIWTEQDPYLYHPASGNWERLPVKEDSAKRSAFFWQKIGQNRILISGSRSNDAYLDLWQLRDRQFELIQFPFSIKFLDTFIWCDIDAQGNTYLSYSDTLFQFDPSGHETRRISLTNICTDCYNHCFQLDPDGSIILMVNWQFFILNKGMDRFVPHPANRFLKAGQNHLHRFILEENGSIWACGQDRNLIFYDAPKDTLYNFHEEIKEILTYPNDFKGIFKDKTGIVWVDTRLGLLKVKPQFYPFEKYFAELNSSNEYHSFRGFAEDSKGIIYGAYYSGIAQIDPTRKQPERQFSLPEGFFFFDLHAQGDQIWTCGGQLFDPQTGKLTEVPSPFFENPVGDNGFFAKDENGTLYWASHYTLYVLKYAETGFEWVEELELPKMGLNKTEALHWGKHSRKLWISFNGKLLHYDPATQKQIWFDPADWGAPNARIMVIEEDHNGKLWLGTNNGLVHADPTTGIAHVYTLNDGLPDDFVCGLLAEGDSCLWLSTNHGLSRFQIPTETFINFFEEDGLTSNEFNRKSYFKASNGQFFFGGLQGVNAFFPEQVMQAYRKRNKRAQIVLSSFEYTDEKRDTTLRIIPFPRQPEIHLHYWDWSYTLEYALTDFSTPDEIFYSYKMEGYKDSWSALSKFNFARFNSLPGGKYIFRVRARDSRGQWHPNELAVKLIVYPPWWATWWAYTLYGILLLGLTLFLRSYELNRQRLKYNLELEKLEAERLKELDSFKTRLYTNLTHEFRTPLTVILGMAGQIKDESARIIERNGKNLLRLINQLLDLSKLEDRSFQLHLKQDDIVSYLRYVTESFHTFANSKNLALRFFSPVESLVMDFDPEQIKKVLVNLISNALKFTPSDGEVTVRLTPGEDWLQIEVQDTGIGIAETDLPHIFDRFYQVDSSTTRTEEGSGIGLAHTLELVKVMKGNISVKSEVGKGSSFTVHLPVRKEAEPLAIEMENMESPGWASPSTGISNSMIEQQDTGSASPLPLLLLIEDNSDVVNYLKSCLEGLYRLDVAYNGKTGIEKALETIPDLIISDVMMPEKDGFEVCDTLKNDERTSHIPIILLTAKADAASRIAGLRRRADAYLAKPFDKEELLVRLENLAEIRRRLRERYAGWQSTVGSPQSAIDSPQPGQPALFELEDAFIQKVRKIVEENFGDEDFGLPQLCRKIGMSRSQLFRKMKALIDESPSDFIRNYRLNEAKRLLETTDLNVSEVAWKVGYKYLAHFSNSYQEFFGEPPSATSK